MTPDVHSERFWTLVRRRCFGTSEVPVMYPDWKGWEPPPQFRPNSELHERLRLAEQERDRALAEADARMDAERRWWTECDHYRTVLADLCNPIVGNTIEECQQESERRLNAARAALSRVWTEPSSSLDKAPDTV